MPSSQQRIIQKEVTFSNCLLWQYQKDFFRHHGLQAWNKQVPYHITNNPNLAHAYAQVVIRFMQEHQQQEKKSIKTPFYILELGAGSGRFSFYFLKALIQLQSTLQLQHLHFIYVMTDFHESIIKQWQAHPKLQAYIDKGLLDFAIYDTNSQNPIHLINNKTSLQDNLNNQPLIVLANYVFDSIPNDIFYIHNQQLHQAMATIQAPQSSVNVNNLNHYQINLNYATTSEHYYSEKYFNEILKEYLQSYTEAFFTIPTEGLRCTHYLRQLSGDKLLLLVTDKGYTHSMNHYVETAPTIDLHSSFSIMVNFDAVARYTEKHGGEYYFQPTHQLISSNAFVFGKTFSQLPETQHMLNEYFGQIGPGNLYNIYQTIKGQQNNPDIKLETLLVQLQLSRYDPYIFSKFSQKILASLPQISFNDKDTLLKCLPIISENYYHIPSTINPLLDIAMIYQQLELFEQALYYYQQALNNQTLNAEMLMNMGICCFALNDFLSAIENFSQAIEQEPENILAYGWLTYAIKSNNKNIKN